MSVDLGEFKPARCLDHGSDVCECSGLRAELAAARDEIERLRPYGDGPPLGCERCELCEGTGTVYVTAGAFGPPEGLPGECWECAGRGWVEGEGVDDESD